MTKLAAVCGTILVLLLSASTLAGIGLPPNQSIGFTAFGACVGGLLILCARLAVEDRKRGKPHAD
jgi:hypothetical protein